MTEKYQLKVNPIMEQFSPFTCQLLNKHNLSLTQRCYKQKERVVEESLDQVIADVQKNTNPNAKSGAAVVMDVNSRHLTMYRFCDTFNLQI
ncbi:hypothetical protein JCM17380_23300 [Desulfosporosinus burensis]